MRSLVPLLLALPLVAFASPASACSPVAVWDDGTHNVTQSGTVVTVNLVGAALSCPFLDVTVNETWSEDVAAPTCWLTFADDTIHSVTQFLVGVTVNDLYVEAGCAPFQARHPEIWTLP